MILSDEKDSPLLPLSTSPPPTNRTTSPPPAHKHGFTLVQAARSFLSGKRRLGIVLSLAVCLVLSLGRYHHSQGGFYPPGNGAEQRPPGGGYQPGDGFESPPIWLGAEAQDAAEAQAKEQKPLTGLGKEADEVYKIDGLNRVAYQEQLESFVRTHFPPADSDEDDPHSLLNDLRRFFHDRSRKGSPRKLPSIPGKLWQTAATHAKYADRQDTTKSFIDMQPHMNITFHDNKQANLWVASRFKMNEPEVPDGAERLPVGIVEAWERLATPAVLRSDFWRYLVLATEGGVYADSDVTCLRPISVWGDDPSWDGTRPADYEPPSLIVGVEADVGDRHDWHQWWPRPLQFSQWTIATARGHPVLIDTLRRVVEMALLPVPTPLPSVMERTGPGPFTDAVLRYARINWGKTWADLRGLGQDGWRYHGKNGGVWGDMKVLSITGFSPGVGHMGAEDVSHAAAMVRHDFAGSWRGQEGANAR